jgi:hypothetical protein
MTMCVMEIHAKSADATMWQAMAHNTKTVRSDIDMLVEVMTARGQFSAVTNAHQAAMFLDHAYGVFLAEFGAFAAEVVPGEIHSHHRDGSERTVVSVMGAAVHQAHRDETR